MVPPGSRCLDWQLQNYVKCSWPIRTLAVKTQESVTIIQYQDGRDERVSSSTLPQCYHLVWCRMVPPGSRCLDWQLQNYVKCSWPIRTLAVKNQLRASNIRMEVCYGSEFVPLIFSSIYGLAFPPVFPGLDRCQSEFPLLI